MDTRFIESLIAVIEEGSIAGAARRQMLTPAAISQRIQALETEFKCQLFSRAGNTVQPTDNCLAILPKAQFILMEVQKLIEETQDTSLKGTLRVGANSTSLIAFIPSTLKAIRTLAPDANFHVVPGNSIDLYQDLQNGNLDAAIMVKPPMGIPKSLRYWILRSEPLVLIHSPSYQGDTRTILENAPYIRFDPTCWGGQVAEQYINHNKIKKQAIFDLDSLEAIAQLVSEGVGVSLVPEWAGLEQFGNKLSITHVDSKEFLTNMVLMTAYHPRQKKLL
ncbi:LysR family transcriptional regulator, partial [Vibrio agarivorans]